MHFSTTSALFLTLSVASALPPQHRSNVPCYEDNTLRLLERFSSQASSFCPTYLASAGGAVPSKFNQVQGQRLSSACSCYEKTAGTVTRTSTASMASFTGSPVVTPTTSTSQGSSVVHSTTMSMPTPIGPTTAPSSTTASTSASSSVATQPSSSSVSSATGTSTISTASTVPTVVAVGGTAKRGLVYDYNSKSAYANFFLGSKYVSWGSNWGDKRVAGSGVTIPDSFMFVPTLRVNGNLESDTWIANAKAAIASGSKYLFASNEPDNAGQANLSPQDTARVYQKYMNQFAGQALLATPAVTNGGGSAGLNFLSSFLDACTGCHFDMINIHHYMQRSDMNVDQAVSALKSYIENDVPALQAKHPQIQGLPIMIGEFWLWDASLTEGGTYLNQIMPYLDGNAKIIGYQAFGGLWTGNFITNDGSGLTPAGTAYKG